MQFIPYLNFNGNCAQAMAFYAKVFGGKIVHQSTFGDMPPMPGMEGQLPESAKNALMHAHLQIGAQSIMASDVVPELCAGAAYTPPQGIQVSIGVDRVDEGRRIFDALSEGGKVTMPYEKTFWSEGFGMVTDRFGTPWMVNVASQPA